MGDRKCQFAGCRSLTFRSTDYCWKHQEGKPHEDEKDPHFTSETRKNSRKPVKEDWRIPIIGLLYFPFAFFLFWLAEFTDAQVRSTTWLVLAILSYSAGIMLLLSPFILPMYGIYLHRITQQRNENGTNSFAVTMFLRISFIVPLTGAIGFWLILSWAGA